MARKVHAAMSNRRQHSAATAGEPSGAELPGDAPLSLGLLPSYVGYHLRRAQLWSFRHFAEVVGADEDITPGLFAILEVIAANPGVSQSRVAAAMDVDRSTIVNVIHRFEAQGLVVRVPSARDRRSNALRLTAVGRARLDRIEGLTLAREAELTENLTAQERQVLIRLLRRVNGRRATAARPGGGSTDAPSRATPRTRARGS